MVLRTATKDESGPSTADAEYRDVSVSMGRAAHPNAGKPSGSAMGHGGGTGGFACQRAKLAQSLCAERRRGQENRLPHSAAGALSTLQRRDFVSAFGP